MATPPQTLGEGQRAPQGGLAHTHRTWGEGSRVDPPSCRQLADGLQTQGPVDPELQTPRAHAWPVLLP